MRLGLVLSSLLYFVALQMQMEACSGCLEKERIGLLEIKAHFVANCEYAESELSSWVEDRASNCCTWDRVKCANISTGHVTQLSLNELRSYAEPILLLNASLFRPFEELLYLNLSWNMYEAWTENQGFPRLKKFVTLDLSYNNLNSSILPSLNGLTSLRTLKLAGNSINIGSLPAQGFPRLKKLETLDLSYNHLNSSILPSLNGLASLRNLKLAGNSIKGSLPAQGFQNFRSFKVLDLSDNQLRGSIEGLCEMMDLVELDLSYNKFTGRLPECLSILTGLSILDLSNNLFSGNFPSFISNLTSLEYLSLSENYLQGSFSLNTLANHTKLQVLHITSQNPKAQVDTEKTRWFPKFQLKSFIIQSCNLNKDQGSLFPNFLLYQYNLEYIDLSHNKLVGAFPNWLIDNNSRMEVISLRNNSFLGNLKPSSIKKYITYLDISNNNITGLLEEDIGIFLPQIEYFNLSMNSCEGSVPASIGKMKISALDLSHNRFSGELLPKHFAMIYSTLELLKLSNNFLQGNIPRFSNCTNLLALYLNNNNFSGTLKEVLPSDGIGLLILDISNNLISGAIPSSIGKFSSMRILLMAENQLEGEIPFELSNMTELEMLDLSQNRLFGTISNFNTSYLRFLYLQKNALSGSIPLSLSTNSKLVTLDLRDNKFSGYIPNWMGKLSKLRVLLLGGNNLEGHIPIQLCQLENVTIMDLSRNLINGSIPSCFKSLSFGVSGIDDFGPNFKTVVGWLAAEPRLLFPIPHKVDLPYKSSDESYKEDVPITVEFRTKSNYYSYKGKILEHMTGLDLSCNKLTGIIPAQIGNLKGVRALNLSHNYLSGSIPKSFSNLGLIESLDLSYNNLSGEIPSQLTQLNFLAIFNVSYNNLSGIPPSTGQFGDFDEENYRGNPGLCGPLLKRKCSAPSKSNNTVDQKETSVDMVAFYWSFIGAYITILLGFITMLYINLQWRMVWFYYMGKLIHKCFPSFPLY